VSSLRVLIVEDIVIEAMDLANLLREMGHVPLEQKQTGIEGFECAASEKPDVVLVDVRLDGDMSGTELARLISGVLAIPVVYVTSYPDDVAKYHTNNTTFPCVVKPPERADVAKCIKEAIEAHEGRCSARVTGDSRSGVFICYAHENKAFLDELSPHLQPMEVVVWSDEVIKPGQQWHNEIVAALENTKVAVALVSAFFLASKFISEVELPTLLQAAEHDGAVILPVVVDPCDFEASKLSQFQCVNHPDAALSLKRRPYRQTVWVNLAKRIKEIQEMA